MSEELSKQLEQRIEALEKELIKQRMEQCIFWKAVNLAGFWGDYLEFGSYKGVSLSRAYHAYFRLYLDFWEGRYDHTTGDREKMLGWLNHAWDSMRFLAFDSWEGLPPTEGLDARFPHFEGGAYAASEEVFLDNCARDGIPREKIVPVKGFFEETLTAETAHQIGLKVVSVVLIDSDLYESARLALDFVTPYLRDGSIIIFDDWFQFNGHPQLGEQLAFSEWCEANPQLKVSEHATEGPWAKSFIVHFPLELKPPRHGWLPNPAMLKRS